MSNQNSLLELEQLLNNAKNTITSALDSIERANKNTLTLSNEDMSIVSNYASLENISNEEALSRILQDYIKNLTKEGTKETNIDENEITSTSEDDDSDYYFKIEGAALTKILNYSITNDSTVDEALLWFLARPSTEETIKPSTVTGHKVLADVNLRATASWNGTKIIVINQGSTVKIVENSGDWSKVTYDGKTGYIHNDYIAGNLSLGTSVGTTNKINSFVLNNLDKLNEKPNPKREKELRLAKYAYLKNHPKNTSVITATPSDEQLIARIIKLTRDEFPSQSIKLSLNIDDLHFDRLMKTIASFSEQDFEKYNEYSDDIALYRIPEKPLDVHIPISSLSNIQRKQIMLTELFLIRKGAKPGYHPELSHLSVDPSARAHLAYELFTLSVTQRYKLVKAYSNYIYHQSLR